MYSSMWNRASARRMNGSTYVLNPAPGAPSHGPGYMAKAAAEAIAEHAAYLHEELEKEASIPSWMEAAIARAKHNLDGVAGFMGVHRTISVGRRVARGSRRPKMRQPNTGALTHMSGCCEPCERGGAADWARAMPLPVPDWKAAGHCCSSCAHGGPCEGGCGDKCTKGCPDHVKHRKANHAAGDRSKHVRSDESYYGKQSVWTIYNHGKAINEMLTGQERLPDWAEHKLYETQQILDDLAHRIHYLRHAGYSLLEIDADPEPTISVGARPRMRIGNHAYRKERRAKRKTNSCYPGAAVFLDNMRFIQGMGQRRPGVRQANGCCGG